MTLLWQNLWKFSREWREWYRESREGVQPLTVLERLRALED